MATKLKNLHLTKVDVVDEGANPRADIALAKGMEPDGAEDGITPREEGLFKRFASWLAKSLDGSVRKDAKSFDDQMAAANMEAISSEMWEVMYALRSSLYSILSDTEMDSVGKASAMTESMSQFGKAMEEYTQKWCAGKTAAIKKSACPDEAGELAVMQRDYRNLGEMIKNAEGQKGMLEDMLKIDKSKMTPEERASYEDLVKKYAVEAEETDPVAKAAEGQEEVIDEGTAGAKEPVTAQKSKGGEDPSGTESEGILKGVVEDLKAEIASLRDASLTQELASVAKKYEALGKKPEELMEVLKKAKKAGVYDEVIAAYDSALAAQEASGMFGEIGKSGHAPAGSAVKSASEAKIEGIAKGLMQSDPTLSAADALAKAWESNPDLWDEYENEAGF